jgi:hypothetical protein
MRFLAYLSRRHTTGESLVLLASAVAVVLGVPVFLDGVGMSQVAAAPISLVLALASYFGIGVLIDRRRSLAASKSQP